MSESWMPDEEKVCQIVGSWDAKVIVPLMREIETTALKAQIEALENLPRVVHRYSYQAAVPDGERRYAISRIRARLAELEKR